MNYNKHLTIQETKHAHIIYYNGRAVAREELCRAGSNTATWCSVRTWRRQHEALHPRSRARTRMPWNPSTRTHTVLKTRKAGTGKCASPDPPRTLRALGSFPEALGSVGSKLYVLGSKLYVFGGSTGQVLGSSLMSNEHFQFSTTDRQWERIDADSRRAGESDTA